MNIRLSTYLPVNTHLIIEYEKIEKSILCTVMITKPLLSRSVEDPEDGEGLHLHRQELSAGAGLPLVDIWMYITSKKSLNTSKIQRWTYYYVLILKPGVSVCRELLPWRNSPVTAQHSTIFTGLLTRKLHHPILPVFNIDPITETTIRAYNCYVWHFGICLIRHLNQL